MTTSARCRHCKRPLRYDAALNVYEDDTRDPRYCPSARNFLHSPDAQTVPVQFCWLHQAGVEHICDECGCWPEGVA